jgi:hypothetical protein
MILLYSNEFPQKNDARYTHMSSHTQKMMLGILTWVPTQKKWCSVYSHEFPHKKNDARYTHRVPTKKYINKLGH